jgi:16S rRNA processing protein RimM
LSQTRGPEPTTNLQGVRLVIGTIGGTHGVRGELKLLLLSDRPDHLSRLSQVYLGLSDTPTRLESIRFPNDGALIKLAGIDTPEEGKKLGGLQVRIDASDAAPLAEGEYFLFQLIGLQAITPDGDAFGEVIDLIETGAHDVLVIRPTQGGEDILIPNHPEYVETIDPDGKRLVARIPVYLENAEG